MAKKWIVVILGVLIFIAPAFSQLVENRDYSGSLSQTIGASTNSTVPLACAG